MDSKKRFLISVFNGGGKWHEDGVKCLKELGFTQQLKVGEKFLPTPAHVFVKYETGEDPSVLRDRILDRIEKTVKKGETSKVYVVVTDDLAPLIASTGD
jgi:hypothetical protein